MQPVIKSAHATSNPPNIPSDVFRVLPEEAVDRIVHFLSRPREILSMLLKTPSFRNATLRIFASISTVEKGKHWDDDGGVTALEAARPIGLIVDDELFLPSLLHALGGVLTALVIFAYLTLISQG